MNYLNGRIGLNRLTAQFLIIVLLTCSFAAVTKAQKIATKIDTKEFTPEVTTPVCSVGKFVLEGTSGGTGTNGNSRTFVSDAMAVKATAFSRRNSDGLWQTGFLGAFDVGVGVTDRGENGNDGSHRVDNVGDRKNYVLLEFNVPVVVDQVYLDSVDGDSDITVWVGNAADPFNNHLNLSDALLSGFAPSEDNDTTETGARAANINAGQEAGNVVVIAASTSDTTPDDQFKIRYLDTKCPTAPCTPGVMTTTGDSGDDGTDGNVRNFDAGSVEANVRAFSRTKTSGVWETAYLGAFSPGLGVTDRSESGGNDTHKVDNNDRLNYVVYGFNQDVVIDKATLDSIGGDSDISVWIGSAANAFNSPITLSDAVLAGFGSAETNDGSTSSRTADINAAQKSGNVLVIAAKTSDSNDAFKIKQLDIKCAPPKAKVTIIKEVFPITGGTASTQSFGFTSVKLGAFSLVDNNVVGPDRFINANITQFDATNAITVTESLTQSWSLSDLTCTETGGIQNSTIDFAGRKATIIPEAGETIVCTFRNSQLNPSAAHVPVSGRVMTTAGTGISRALVTITNAGTGESVSAMTNTFGYYSVEAEVGSLYILSAAHKRYTFVDSVRTIALLDESSGNDFIESY